MSVFFFVEICVFCLIQQYLFDSGDMGDNLPAVNLGADFVTVGLILSEYSSCVRSMSGKMKCFGDNGHGRCGRNNSVNKIGVTSDSMGDNLPVLDLGTDFDASAMAHGSVAEFNCAADLNFNERWRCWGYV